MKQSQALDIMKMGHNVYLTGAAGSGKTYVLNQFIDYLKKHKIPTGITASTGIASTHINGMTIHSWSGIGVRDEITKQDLKKMAQKSQLSKRLARCRVLIIDEVSMLHGRTLDNVDQVCRYLKDDDKPFGGLQLILCGDLFQLPPVTRYEKDQERPETDFVYRSDAWKSAKLKICYLSEQHRQGDDDLIDILNAIRTQEVEQYHVDSLAERRGASTQDEVLTQIFTHNIDVDQLNNRQLADLEAEEEVYFTNIIKGGKKTTQKLIDRCLAPERLILKQGAQVMFVANNPQYDFVNGTRGTVVNFTNEDNYPVVETLDGRIIVAKPHSWKLLDGDKVRAEISQIPLRLAWAITVHKSQGMTLDAAEIDIGKSFEPGMGYVALSRVRSIDGLYIKDINNLALQIHPQILEFDSYLNERSGQLITHIEAMDDEQVKALHQRVREALIPKETELTDSDAPKDYDKDLFEKLKKWRYGVAKKKSVPTYVVMQDSTLKHIANSKPTSEEELLLIPGIGPSRLEAYGEDVILKVTTAE